MHGARQALQRLGVAGQILRISPDGIDRRAHRERLAVAIGDGAAMRADGGHARETRRAFTGQEAVLQQLQLHRTAREGHAGRQQQAEHYDEPEAKGAGPRGAGAVHGVGILMSLEAGMRI